MITLYTGNNDHSTCTGGDCPIKANCARVTPQLELFHVHHNAPWNPDTGRCDHYKPTLRTDLPPLPEIGCCSN